MSKCDTCSKTLFCNTSRMIECISSGKCKYYVSSTANIKISTSNCSSKESIDELRECDSIIPKDLANRIKNCISGQVIVCTPEEFDRRFEAWKDKVFQLTKEVEQLKTENEKLREQNETLRKLYGQSKAW